MDVRLLKTTPLILLLGCGLAACGGQSEDPVPLSAPKEETPKEGNPSEIKEKMVFEGPGALLPKEVNGFKISSAPRYFGPGNLYDLINGGAEIYVEFGLFKMVTADFKSPAREGISVTVEVYDQGSLLGAFGRTARFLAGRKDLTGIGEGLPENLKEKGMFGGTDLVYYKDKYLVHVTLLDESPSATPETMTAVSKEILPGFAAAVSDKIKADPALPPIYAAFPATHRIARGNAYEVQRLAGTDVLGSGYTYRYTDGKSTWSLFVSDELEDAGAAMKKADEKASNNSGMKSMFKVSGKRIFGAQTFEESFAAGVEEALGEFGKSLGQ